MYPLPYPPLPPRREEVSHGLHLVLTIFTFGLWIWVWVIVFIMAESANRRERLRFDADHAVYQHALYMYYTQYGPPPPAIQ